MQKSGTWEVGGYRSCVLGNVRGSRNDNVKATEAGGSTEFVLRGRLEKKHQGDNRPYKNTDSITSLKERIPKKTGKKEKGRAPALV